MNHTSQLSAAIRISLTAFVLVAVGWEISSAQAPSEEKQTDLDILKASSLEYAAADNELQKSLKDRYNAALEVAQAGIRIYQSGLREGENDLGLVWEQVKQLLNSELELTDVPDKQVKLREKYMELAIFMVKFTEGKHRAGRDNGTEYRQARYNLADAHVQLLRAKQKAGAVNPR